MEEYLKEKTILIVDDTPENIDVLNGLLTNFKRKIATNGERALEFAISDTPPDLILLDIMMPEMDGFEVCKKLRNNDITKEIPVIFLTAKTAKEDVVKGFELGGQDYVTKPFDVHELLERVKTQLQLSHQKQLLQNMNNILEEKVKERTEELRKSNENLNKANNSLTVLDEAKNDFLNLISHEIRTPLNGIVGSMDFLKEMISDPELIEFFEMLKESVDRLENFSGLALEITEMRAKGATLGKEKFNIITHIKEVLNRFGEEIGKKNLTLSLDIQEEIILESQSNYFKKSMLELISNTVKFADSDTTIWVKTSVTDGNVLVSVSDQGEVIPPEKIEEIVKPFGLAKEHYDKNIGLGLAYIKQYLDLNDASLEISSTEEKTEFTLIFNI